ncbi:sigma-E processing peptidase SpoIIGA [Bacillus pseudomycoides]|uniref:Sporulation sigma-E factor-processing peptidase n=1 Tax=Bacillus pseudomycoides TaxID=64104 RepID=A0ABD6T8V4_9BACI|nr:sigma-E processing peptidase SpoIIGA [Bacillus pseudomycoides]PEK22177.1 sigma-E processing peptidase SpoIIGA [Bacillus pseudomycoides]PEK70915.1 sigma-E processing peptidase SpoIIGA [Bacillus pseudomycoides]PEO42914.1 sigma-E processing peptidase SpoIIGA [Bacillus pseudomycoides]PEP40337.1 sigma-E processing peptidase SpoIIGA [Bacillus pseudomycoides]
MNCLVVYADVVWLLNACIDFLLLLLTATVLKKKIKRWRLVLGTFIGSTIVIFAFTPFASMMTHPIMKLLYSLLIVYTAFGFSTFRDYTQIVFTFYFVTFMVGGGLIGTHFFLQTNDMVDGLVQAKAMSYGDPVSWMFVILGFPIIYYFSKKRIENVEVTKIHYDQIVQVNIRLVENEIKLDGLIDSGNQLHDPITKTPVMIMHISSLEHCLPTWLIEQIYSKTEIPQIPENDSGWATRLRLIPFRAVGVDHQFLWAIKPDVVQIYHEGSNMVVNKVLIGLNTQQLSTNGEYQCIIHPKMLISPKVTIA